MNDNFKGWMDVLSVSTVLATLSAWLPPMAALVSLVWGCIRVYETRTVQKWLSPKREDFTCMYAGDCEQKRRKND